MKTKQFVVVEATLFQLLQKFPEMGKNSDVGKMAVEIVKLYFLGLDQEATFQRGQNGVDLQVSHLGQTESFEIKGTAGTEICWNKLKVSSQACCDTLKSGTILIRVCGVGTSEPTLHFLKFDEDFEIVPEVRYAIKKKKIA